MSRWPNFFIVGAPRAATSSLYLHLKGHPHVYMPTVKEPHFFAQVELGGELDTDYVRSLGQFRREEDYLRLFEDAGTSPAVGEASVHYLYDELAPVRIHERIPEAKIIITLRDPVERAYSHYLTTSARGESVGESFRDAIIKDYARPRKVLGQAFLYVESGLYYQGVKRYLNTFGPERVRIYLYDDFVSNTAGVIKDVCRFLGVPFLEGRFFDPRKKYNISGASRSAIVPRLWATHPVRLIEGWLMRGRMPWAVRLVLRRLLRRSAPPIDSKARRFLQSLYRDDIVKLQDLIGRDLRNWL